MAEGSGWKESLSLEETNKIRVSLGLKPIADPAASSSTPAALEGDALAEANYAKRREAEQKEKEAKELKERIDKARNQKERLRRLGGRGLGEADEDEAQVKQEEGAAAASASDDAKAWVRRQKKKAKELAAKREKEQEEADRLAEQEEADQVRRARPRWPESGARRRRFWRGRGHGLDAQGLAHPRRRRWVFPRLFHPTAELTSGQSLRQMTSCTTSTSARTPRPSTLSI